MNKKQTLAFHIGAHKTATTHFQNTLALLEDELKGDGVRYFPLDVVRQKFNSFYFMHDMKKRLFSYSPEFLKIKWLEDIFNISGDYQRYLFSEENMLGSMDSLLDAKKPYPLMNERLNFIQSLSKKYDIEIFLSIRNFADIYPGAYTTALRFYPEVILNARNNLLKNLETDTLPSWYSLIKRLRDIFPTIPVTVWTHEYYKEHQSELFAVFAGRKLANIPNVEVPANTATPNARGIELIEQNIKGREKLDIKWKDFCISVTKKNLPQSPSDRYTFLNESQRLKLNKQYTSDLHLLADDKSLNITCLYTDTSKM
ncbi:hypothetical protein BFC18_15880 [Alteromonas confluentis]|uniref:Sulfotransferase domain-containing protein n=1 Tax=Alteromonas confluentis TaxID=1656094 RepID=A0A1E7Z913_9ALTE|nr:hypothetical protein BFC18_15880 [Alteromonas confluentis]